MLLFDFVPDATLNKGKSVRDIEDIVSLMADELLPIFVARELTSSLQSVSIILILLDYQKISLYRRMKYTNLKHSM